MGLIIVSVMSFVMSFPMTTINVGFIEELGAEMSLSMLACNMKRVINIFRVNKLIKVIA